MQPKLCLTFVQLKKALEKRTANPKAWLDAREMQGTSQISQLLNGYPFPKTVGECRTVRLIAFLTPYSPKTVWSRNYLQFHPLPQPPLPVNIYINSFLIFVFFWFYKERVSGVHALTSWLSPSCPPADAQAHHSRRVLCVSRSSPSHLRKQCRVDETSTGD